MIAKIDKNRRNFLLGCVNEKRKMAKISWKKNCLPKEKGGVMVVDLSIKNVP